MKVYLTIKGQRDIRFLPGSYNQEFLDKILIEADAHNSPYKCGIIPFNNRGKHAAYDCLNENEQNLVFVVEIPKKYRSLLGSGTVCYDDIKVKFLYNAVNTDYIPRDRRRFNPVIWDNKSRFVAYAIENGVSKLVQFTHIQIPGITASDSPTSLLTNAERSNLEGSTERSNLEGSTDQSISPQPRFNRIKLGLLLLAASFTGLGAAIYAQLLATSTAIAVGTLLSFAAGAALISRRLYNTTNPTNDVIIANPPNQVQQNPDMQRLNHDNTLIFSNTSSQNLGDLSNLSSDQGLTSNIRDRSSLSSTRP